MEGYLELWQGLFSRWCKYYFRIKDEMLIFGPNKQKIEYKVHLKVAQIITTVDDPICLIIHTGTQTLHVRANSIDERVKWFKKLKGVQKQSENAYYNKEIEKLNEQLGKHSKVKVLEQYTVELWKSHADLQNMLEDLNRTTNLPYGIKKLLDKLRMTVQQIKFKNFEALQIIEQYVVDIKNKKDNPDTVLLNKDNSFEDINQTKFMSFTAEKTGKMSSQQYNKFYTQSMRFVQPPKFHSKHSFQKNGPNFSSNNQQNMTKFHSFEAITPQEDFPQHNLQKISNSKTGGFFSNDMHPIKQKLLKENEVFKLTSGNINTQGYRHSLPEKFTLQQKLPILSILSGAIGTDISKITLPVIVNEPLSALQKGCQQMYYSQLLDKADSQEDPLMRIIYVTGFVVSQYSLNEGRIKKPFNPLLGQTFQYIDDKRQFQYLSQQVSHHPPISAIYCRSNHFEYFDNSKSKSSFTGSSLKLVPESNAKLILEKNRDIYVWDKATAFLNGLVMGKTYIEIVGDIKIICNKSNYEAFIHFKQGSFWKKGDLHGIEGHISEKGNKIFQLNGKWNESLIDSNLAQKHTLNESYYNFNDMSFQLNHLNKFLLDSIAPTDSRLRPDQRALEYRMIQLAGKQKNRVQDKQRARRRQFERLHKKHQPLWLVPDPNSKDEVYVNNGRYWEQKRIGKWDHCLDIY